MNISKINHMIIMQLISVLQLIKIELYVDIKLFIT